MKKTLLDRRQNALVKMLFDAAKHPEDAPLEMVLQDAGHSGLSTALVRAQEKSAADKSGALILRCNAADGSWEGLRSLGRNYSTRGSGYMGRLYDLFERVRGDGRTAITLVVDHAGMMRPENIARIYRSAAECALQLGMSLRVVFIINMIPVYDHKKKCPVYKLPTGAISDPLKARWRTWMWEAAGFRLMKPAQLVQLVGDETPLLDETPQEESRIVKIA